MLLGPVLSQPMERIKRSLWGNQNLCVEVFKADDESLFTSFCTYFSIFFKLVSLNYLLFIPTHAHYSRLRSHTAAEFILC